MVYTECLSSGAAGMASAGRGPRHALARKVVGRFRVLTVIYRCESTKPTLDLANGCWSLSGRRA